MTTTRVLASPRGALAAALSAVISVAAHGSALHRPHGPGTGHGHDLHSVAELGPAAPTPSALVVLVIVLIALGVAVARSATRRPGPTGLVALLVLGQGTGHLALSVGAAESAHPLTPSAAMVLAHALAAVAAAAVILTVEATAGTLTATWARIVAAITPILSLSAPLRVQVPAAGPVAATGRRVGGTGSRAPPVLV